MNTTTHADSHSQLLHRFASSFIGKEAMAFTSITNDRVMELTVDNIQEDEKRWLSVGCRYVTLECELPATYTAPDTYVDSIQRAVGSLAPQVNKLGLTNQSCWVRTYTTPHAFCIGGIESLPNYSEGIEHVQNKVRQIRSDRADRISATVNRFLDSEQL